jgi:hypothetical protein
MEVYDVPTIGQEFLLFLLKLLIKFGIELCLYLLYMFLDGLYFFIFTSFSSSATSSSLDMEW